MDQAFLIHRQRRLSVEFFIQRKGNEQFHTSKASSEIEIAFMFYIDVAHSFLMQRCKKKILK